MEDSYISRRDKIVASAIELIGDLGLHALTPKNLARKQNISDTPALSFHSKKHSLQKGMQRCFSRFVFSVNNIDPIRKQDLLIRELTEILQDQFCYLHNLLPFASSMACTPSANAIDSTLSSFASAKLSMYQPRRFPVFCFFNFS